MELFKNKEIELEFKINLEGNSSKPTARLLLESSGVVIGVNANISEGVASAKVPALSSIMKDVPNSCNMLLEVMVDDGYYVPWREEAVSIKSGTTVAVTEAVVKNEAPARKVVMAEIKQEPVRPQLREATPPVTAPKLPEQKEELSESSSNIDEFLDFLTEATTSRR